MSEIIARLVLYYRPFQLNWVEMKQVNLTLPVVRIGRAKDCELCMDFITGKTGAAISRYHATLIKWQDQTDYQIRDGKPGDATIATPDPPSQPSGLGTWLNARKLEEGEKVILKDKDEVSLIKGTVKFVYLRPQNKVSDSLPLNDDTYIPPELYADDE